MLRDRFSNSTFKKSLYFGLVILISSSLAYLSYEIFVLHKTTKGYTKIFKKLSRQVVIKDTFPKELKVPFADESGIVISTKKISIRNVDSPYNPSLVENGSGYRLYFRFDTYYSSSPQYYYTNIGCVELDENFEQTEKESTIIETNSQFSEDPRAINFQGQTFLIYNDIILQNPQIRGMHIGQVDIEKSKVSYSTRLDLQFSWMEKNWSPFVYQENGKSNIYFEYSLSPHKILKLEDPSDASTLTHIIGDQKGVYQNIPWKTWGPIRGGAPAIKMESEYLGFFHSSFRSDGLNWFVIGAYTFESKPPFRITSISPFPILFKGIYETPITALCCFDKRVIYPSGMVIKNDLVHVACGENDSGIKIISFNKAALLKSMKKIH